MKKLFNQSVCFAVPIILLVSLTIESAFAQATLNTNQKIQVVNMAANAAAQQVKDKKDFPLAKLLLYGAVEPAFRIIPFAASNPQVGAAINQFAGASIMTWPGAPQQPDIQAMNAFLQKYTSNRSRIAELAMAFNVFNMPSGKSAYRRKVADIKARGDQVSKEMGEFLNDAPPAANFLMSPPHLQQGMQMFSQFFHIVFGQIFVGDHVKKIVPELQKETNAHISTAKAGKTVAGIGLELGEAQRKLQLLKTIDSKNTSIKSMETGIETAREHLNKVYSAQVAKNRFPKDAWNGSDSEHKKLLKEVRAAFARLTGDEIIKINITSESFTEGWEGWLDKNDVWHAAYFGHIRAAAVVKHSSGSYRVLGQSFYRTLNVNSWSALKEWKILYNFKILKENI